MYFTVGIMLARGKRWQIRAWNTPWSLALEFTMLVCLRGIARPTCRCFRWLVDVNPWEFTPWEPGKVVEELFVEAKIMVPSKQKQCRWIKSMAETDDYWWLGGGFKYFLFSPLFGEDSHFDWYFSNGLKPPSRWLITEKITDGLSTMKSDETWWEKIEQMQSLRVKLM